MKNYCVRLATTRTPQGIADGCVASVLGTVMKGKGIAGGGAAAAAITFPANFEAACLHRWHCSGRPLII